MKGQYNTGHGGREPGLGLLLFWSTQCLVCPVMLGSMGIQQNRLGNRAKDQPLPLSLTVNTDLLNLHFRNAKAVMKRYANQTSDRIMGPLVDSETKQVIFRHDALDL